MNTFILVTGGARSGKSSYALERCEALPGSRCFVATCPTIDPEMDERIVAHKSEREGRGWQTIEEQTDLASLFLQADDYQTVLVDCLTLWVNNLLYQADREQKIFAEKDMKIEVEKLCQAIAGFSGSVCLVTNEVGMSIVPDNALARKYRDLVGYCNRYLAQRADEVILVTCGIPLHLKTLTNHY